MATGFVQRWKGKIVGTDVYISQLPHFTNAMTGITAHAGGGQSSATALTAFASSVDTVGTAADSVILLPSAVGLMYMVYNSTANSMQVFGTSPDTINAVATATGVAQAAGKMAIYYCFAVGNWVRFLSA